MDGAEQVGRRAEGVNKGSASGWFSIQTPIKVVEGGEGMGWPKA